MRLAALLALLLLSGCGSGEQRARSPATPAPTVEKPEPPREDELSPSGGTWSGSLSDLVGDAGNQLTWSFVFELGEVEREAGTTEVRMTIDDVPLPDASGTAIERHSAEGEGYGTPMRPIAEFFDNHRYRAARVRVLDRKGSRLRVAAEVTGDLDGLGVPRWSLDDWLEFDGYLVAHSEITSLGEARARLSRLVDLRGLKGEDGPGLYNFRPRSR